MKRIQLILPILTVSYFSAFAQRQYGQTLQTESIYPLETTQFFRSGQSCMPLRSFSMTPHFYPNPPVAAYAPEGFYLFKKHKKKSKMNYAKKSHIVRF